VSNTEICGHKSSKVNGCAL